MAGSCKQVEVEHYRFDEYVSKGRWNSFYHQIKEIIKFEPHTILEVGEGSGILGTILRQQGYSYETIDVAEDLHPNYVGSVINLPFDDNTYDVVGCFQVLEHIEYSFFDIALKELLRVAQKAVIISVPDARLVWRYSIHIPKVGIKTFLLPSPFSRIRNHVFDGEHYWEINKKGYKLKDVKKHINAVVTTNGFTLAHTYRVWEHPFHRFFVLSRLL